MILNYALEAANLAILIFIIIFSSKLKDEGRKRILVGVVMLIAKQILNFILLVKPIEETIGMIMSGVLLFAGYFIILLGLKRGEK
jgi:hypothetical protein